MFVKANFFQAVVPTPTRKEFHSKISKPDVIFGGTEGKKSTLRAHFRNPPFFDKCRYAGLLNCTKQQPRVEAFKQYF